MNKFLVLAVAAAAMAGAWPNAVPAQQSQFTMQFRSQWHSPLQLAFYSRSRNFAWPGGDGGYTLNPGRQDFTLNCQAGEQICWGAWEADDRSSYWGTGYGGRENCPEGHCCFTCNGGSSGVQVLED